MFCDLNVPLRASPEIFDMLIKLGYQSVALNYIVDSNSHILDAPVFKDESSGVGSKTLPMGSSRGQLKKYKRLTLILDDMNLTRLLVPSNPMLSAFDVIAVVPKDEKSFNAACTSLDVDIIVIENKRLRFILKLPTLRSAIARGIHFELSVGSAIRDASSRCSLFENGSLLVRGTKGKSILLSGDAESADDLRAPNDIANLCSLFGLEFSLGKAAVSNAGLSIIRRGETRKIAGGVIRVIEPSTQSISDASTVSTPTGGPSASSSSSKKKRRAENMSS